MISLTEAMKRVTRRLEPHCGVYNVTAGDQVPVAVIGAGTDMPGAELVQLIGQEVMGTVRQGLEAAGPDGLTGEELAVMLTGPMTRMLLLGWEFGRSRLGNALERKAARRSVRGVDHARGREVHLGTHDTRELAQAAVDLARGGYRPASNSVASWAGTVWDLFPGRRTEETTEHYVAMCAPFVRMYGHLALGAVDFPLAQTWSLKHPGHVPYLRRMFGKAHQAGLLTENVWERVEVFAESAPRVPPPPEVLIAILAECRRRGGWWADDFGPMVEVAAYTGARSSGLARVMVTDVDLERRRMTVTEKGEKTREVALLGPSLETMRARCAVRIGRVFSTRTGRRHNVETVGVAWRDVAGAVGWDGVFHGLKHYVATWLTDLGAAENDVAIQLGHTDKQGRPYPELVRRNYSHPDPELALQRLEAVASGASGLTGSRVTEGSDGHVGGPRAA